MPADIIQKSRQWWKGGSFLMAVIVQAGIVLIASLVIVLVPSDRTEPEFVSQKTVYLPQRQLDHTAAVSEFQQQASRPAMMERLTTSALVPDGVPELPTLPTSQMTSMEVSDFMASDAEALLAESGIMGALGGLEGAEQVASFFGVETTRQRIVICFDVSLSVVNRAERVGIPFSTIREEAIELIQGFGNNTLFNMIQFVRNYEVFQETLIPGAPENREIAANWMRNRFVTSGSSRDLRNAVRKDPNGIESVLRAAFAMEPEVIFIISDGNFFRTPPGGGNERVTYEEIGALIDDLQTGAPREVTLYFLGFEMSPENRRAMERIVGSYGGEVRQMGR
ncbi:MAG: hypothetical protein LAT55_04540 [Opitutales bacterium]|nr:hypothetical protein [Opitutales bacterium]